MSVRIPILLCHAPEDKQWAIELESAFTKCSRNAEVVLWDGRKHRQSDRICRSQPANLSQALNETVLVVCLASGHFLKSRVFRKLTCALRPVAQRRNLDVVTVVTSHCLHELTWLDASTIIFAAAQPLDSLNPQQEEIALGEIAEHIALRFGFVEPADILPDMPVAEQPKATVPFVLHAKRLTTYLDEQKERFLRLRLEGALFALVALVAGAFAVFCVAGRNWTLFISLVGFAVSTASLAAVSWARRSLMEQRIISARYIQSSFIDPTIPSRQRSGLARKADAILH